MALNSFLTPSNNEYKEQLLETRYMSRNDVISDTIKKLMDIDIIRDIANKNMKLNPDMPYDIASITARQEYLGDPITGIDMPIVIEEEDNNILNDDEELLDNDNTESFEVEIPKVDSDIKSTNEEVLTNDIEALNEEVLTNNDNIETLPDTQVNEEEILTDIEVPKIEEILPEDKKETNSTENHEEIEQISNDELLEINDQDQETLELLNEKHSDLVDDITNEYNPYSSLDNTLLDNLPIEVVKNKEEELENERIEEKLSNTLTNGLSIDFLDEPVLQKVKKR